MNDTSSAAHEKMLALMRQKSGEERLKMGCSMFNTARELVLASFPKDATETDKRLFLFKRFYGSDFSKEQRERFVKRMVSK